MKRLTELYTNLEIEIHNSEPEARHLKKGDFRPKNNALLSDCVQKLGQLEDIEDELGIDLITLFKVSKGIAVYNESKTAIEIDVIPTIDLLNKRLITYTGDLLKPYKTLYFKDYGKTWALTEEELKKC